MKDFAKTCGWVAAFCVLSGGLLLLSADPTDKQEPPLSAVMPFDPLPQIIIPEDNGRLFAPFENAKGQLMSSTGPNLPGTATSDSSYGAEFWANPTNVFANDGTYAVSTSFGGTSSEYLKATNFGFALASDQVIDGIEVKWYRGTTGGGAAVDDRVRIVKGGTIGSTELGAGATWSSGSIAVATFGGPTDLCGETWSYSDINASTFGAAISCASTGFTTTNIDYVTITVYHHTGTPPDAVGPGGRHKRVQRENMWFFRQSTASQEFPLGQFVDDVDGVTPETALSIGNTDIKFQVAGSTSFASKNSGGATHIADGNYYAVADATDTATIGSGRIKVLVTGALQVQLDFVVLHANLYDWLFGSSAPGTGTALDAAGIRSAVGLASANLDTQLSTIDTVVDDILVDTGTTLDGKINTIDTVVDSILVDTTEIGAAGAGLTAVPWNAAWDAEVQSEVQDAIEANNLDHLMKIAVDTNFATTVHLDSVIGHLADNGTSATFDRTTDSLEAARDNIGTAGAGLTVDANTVPNGTGTATAGAATTITIQTALGANDRCIGCEIDLTGGTGSGQTRTITDYDNGTKVVTVDRPWVTNPDNTTTYKIRHANSAVSTVCRIGNAFTSSAGTEVRVSAWLERNGQVVTTYAASASCTFTFREHGSGSDLFSVTDSAVNAQGIFESTQATPGFTSDRLYLASAAITEGGNVFTTREPVPVFG